MGTTCLMRENSPKTPHEKQQFIINLLEQTCEGQANNKVVQIMNKGKIWYAAVKIHHNVESDCYEKSLDGSITIAVIIITSSHQGGFCYKCCEESAGPYYYDATKSFIALLSPLKITGCYAWNWRVECLKKSTKLAH